MQKKDKKVKKIMMKKVSHMPLYHGIYRLKENFYIKNEEWGSNEENCR